MLKKNHEEDPKKNLKRKNVDKRIEDENTNVNKIHTKVKNK